MLCPSRLLVLDGERARFAVIFCPLPLARCLLPGVLAQGVKVFPLVRAVSGQRLHGLRHLLLGGGEHLGQPDGLGLTETYGPITVSPEQEGWRELPAAQRAGHLARQGQGYVSADLVRVVDEQMRDVVQDGQAMGEVVMRGNNVMSGYFRDEAATSKAFAGGWFHSGDLAVWHPDGTIELRDRGKDVIISGGENISSIEVEQAIAAHPAVLECAVIGIPHPHWGERPKAFITLNEGATATPEEIIAFCRERLARYKCPDTIELGPLPKTSTGKVQKFVLRDREWAGRDKRIGAT